MGQGIYGDPLLRCDGWDTTPLPGGAERRRSDGAWGMVRGDVRRQGEGRGADGHVSLRPLAPLARARARRWARRRAARLAALYDFATLLAGERDLDRLLHALVEGLAARFAYRYVSVFLLEEGQLRLRAQVGYATPITALALGEGITGLVGRDGRPTLVRDGRRHPGYRFAEAHFGYSLGLATAAAPGGDAAALLARADRAMYDAKRWCGGSVRFLPVAAGGDGRIGA